MGLCVRYYEFQLNIMNLNYISSIRLVQNIVVFDSGIGFATAAVLFSLRGYCRQILWILLCCLLLAHGLGYIEHTALKERLQIQPTTCMKISLLVFFNTKYYFPATFSSNLIFLCVSSKSHTSSFPIIEITQMLLFPFTFYSITPIILMQSHLTFPLK